MYVKDSLMKEIEPCPDAERIQGIVTKLLPSKGFGFLRGDDGQSRFIPAASSPKFDELREGKSVSFVPVFEKTGKGNGLRAQDVEPTRPRTLANRDHY